MPPDHLDRLDIRFVETGDPIQGRAPGEAVLGMIGLVPEEGAPIPFKIVHVGGRHGTPERSLARGMAEAGRIVHESSCRHAATLVPIDDVVEAIVAHIRADIAQDPENSTFSWAWDDEEDLAGQVAAALRPTLHRVDSFRITRDFCRTLQVDGDMRLFRLVEPLGARVVTEAARDECIVAALTSDAERLAGVSRPFARSAQAWREAMETLSAPSP